MNNEKLFELYEKLYFHEVESRDRITNRLQMPLALLVSIVSIYAFILQSLAFNTKNCWIPLFVVLGLVSLALFIASVWHFIEAYYGSVYEFLPSAQDSEDYRQTLIKQYEAFDGTDGNPKGAELSSKYFDEYLCKYYIRASSTNVIVNDLRSYNIHKCNSYTIFNIIPILFMFLIFNYSGINKNDQEKEFNVKIVSPMTVESPKVIIKDSVLSPELKESQ